MEKISTSPDTSEALIDTAVARAREALMSFSGPVEIQLPQGQWSMADFQNEPARALEAAIEDSGEHSGGTFTQSLQKLVAQIESDGSFTVARRDDASGNVKIIIDQG